MHASLNLPKLSRVVRRCHYHKWNDYDLNRSSQKLTYAKQLDLDLLSAPLRKHTRHKLEIQIESFARSILFDENNLTVQILP